MAGLDLRSAASLAPPRGCAKLLGRGSGPLRFPFQGSSSRSPGHPSSSARTGRFAALTFEEPRRVRKHHERNVMGNFLRENWVYIVAPLVLILLGLGIFILFFSDSSSSNFIYNIF
jgi:hypothetical protein